MYRKNEYIKLQLQQKFKSPVGVRENEETLYANIAHEPLMLDQVRQIEVLQIYDANEAKIRAKQEEPVTNKCIWLYIIDKRQQFLYSSDGLLFYKGNFYTQQELQDNFGITLTPSIVYYANKGVIKCWYNPALKLFWDVETSAWYQIPPNYNDNPSQDVTDMDEVGAMGLFLYYNENNEPVKYGSLISGTTLHPMVINVPKSGYFSISDLKESKVTGTWKLLTETKETDALSPCIVLAIKVSDNPIIGSSNTPQSSSVNSNYSVIETTEYNL